VNIPQVLAWLNRNEYEDVTAKFAAITPGVDPNTLRVSRVVCPATDRSVQISVDVDKAFIVISAEGNVRCNRKERKWVERQLRCKLRLMTTYDYAEIEKG